MIDASQIFDGVLGTGSTAPTGTAITATRDSLNTLNMLAPADQGADAILGLQVYIMQSFATLTSLDIEFQGSPDNSTFYTLLAQKAIPVAQLIAGASIFRYGWPLDQYANTTAGVLRAPLQYYKFVYTVNGSNATAGSVLSFVAPINDRQQYRTYAENYTTQSGI